MLVALVGTPSAGKHTVLDYLVQQHGFVTLDVAPPPANSVSLATKVDQLSLAPSPSPATSGTVSPATTTFPTPDALLEHATRHWRTHYVTTSLRSHADVEPFLKRPFFLLVAVDAPLRARYAREAARVQAAGGAPLGLDAFVDAHDALMSGGSDDAGSSSSAAAATGPPTDFARVLAAAHVTVCNRFTSRDALFAHLAAVDLLNEERLRPGWDLYFMTLASLASHRSNCMKRRVGAVLVRSKRILSTGYNGTARGTKNCNHGGCPRCNGPAKGGESLSNCLCLHAEENALLEAGRERIGPDAVLYCNTCPCLLCSVKIVQCGVREVVYNQSYSMDSDSARVLEEGGVVLRQLHMPGQDVQ